ncbi:hypothetical protein MMC26_003726 [Xylographa opegraphella]|nr:hypothetical protein [Xylographa opegraphella]
MSNIRVSVQWQKSTVFAGENIECTITFKNTSSINIHSRSPSPHIQPRRVGQNRDQLKLNSPQQQDIDAVHAANPGASRPSRHGHRSTLSLNTSSTGVLHRAPPPLSNKVHENADSANRRHKRSVSIISISHDSTTEDPNSKTSNPVPARNPPPRQHGRSASLQPTPLSSRIVHNGSSGLPNALGILAESSSTRASSMPFRLSRSATNSSHSESRSRQGSIQGRQSSSDRVSGSRLLGAAQQTRTESNSPNFRFPRTSPTANGYQDKFSQATPGASPNFYNTRQFTAAEPARPVPKVVSPVSVSGTPRSSVDLYTMSNNSSETLASEYISPSFGRQNLRNGHVRQPLHLSPFISHTRPPETIMMGYAQVMGSFTLDGSLVNLAPFETVKRKGVIGGQGGGGVVGVEPPKKETGLLGAFGLSSIGESLGGLLGNSEPSSIREMKGIANSNSVPILSTPQAILFVDLRLAPGESKSYKYTYCLPRGIPPTHKGKAMKVVYQLVIGTQRAQTAAQQHVVKHVDVPFRVLAGVNGNGDILGHDLMQPHIILKNTAYSEPIENDIDRTNGAVEARSLKRSDSSPEDFLSYVESLLDNTRRNSSLGLLSPTEATTPGFQLGGRDEDISTKELIDLALVRGNAPAAKRSANRFQIQRGGQQVGVILLARPAYRLGEAVSAVVDFRGADVQSYSVNISLETSEVIDPSIALRSSSSIHRATRRIHASSSEDTLFAEQVIFSAMIPINVAPEFLTTGIQLQWRLRFEFVTSAHKEEEPQSTELLEEVGNDERGITFSAIQRLSCESFDVAVPIRVYGTVVSTSEHHDVHDYPI